MSDNFIVGIFNYCDRWCERCPLTARCRVYAMEERRRSDEENAEFWHHLDDLAQESTDKQNSPFPPLDAECLFEDRTFDEGDEEDELDDDEPYDSVVEREPMVKLGMDYGMKLHEWMKKEIDSRQMQGAMGTALSDVADELVADAFEVVNWFSFLIGVKLARAMSSGSRLEDEPPETGTEDQFEPISFGDDEEYDEETSEILKESAREDRDVSAKIALIGIERSLGAWTILRNHLPQHDPQIREFQQMLGRLRCWIDRKLPGARTFQRPGFDYDV